jgi:site-specific DNA recombinase
LTEPARCAIYARYSSEKQNALSIDQQFRKCREYADRNGLRVLDAHLYADEAISGATDVRDGLQRLLKAARTKPRPFDVILVDDTSRLTRRLRDGLKIFDDLKLQGIGAIFVSQGIDTRGEDSEMRFAMQGVFDANTLKDISRKTRRGVEQRAIDGFHTGGRVFGYKHVRVLHPSSRDAYGQPIAIGVKLEVHAQQAATVQRIFERYLIGHSLKRVALDLNNDGVISPQPQRGRVSQTWCPSSVRHILRNERYRGVVIWGKTQKVRSEKGTRIYRKKNESDWRRTEIPSQRIVTDKLFDAVRARINAVNQLYQLEGSRPGLLRARASTSQYIFSGLLKCSVCNGSVTIVSGKSGTRQDVRYGCSMHSSRGGKVCSNNLLVARQALEDQLLAGLQDRVLHSDVVDYTLGRFEQELTKALRDRAAGFDATRRQTQTIERKIANLTRALSDGYSPAITSELAQLERQLADAAGRLADSEPLAVERRIRDTRKFVESRLADLRGLLSSEATTVRSEIAKHVQKIVLTPTGRTYVASGSWDLLGTAAWMVPGARIELATPAFSGRRSTTELPRQCGS